MFDVWFLGYSDSATKGEDDMRSVIIGMIFVIVGLVFAACSGDEEEGSSGATCPTGSTLTYDTFGKEFVEQYCTRCHSSALAGETRNGAPSDYNLDALAGIHDVGAEEIDGEAAAGPSNVNTSMPPSEPKPTDAERRLLGEWLACGMP